MVSWGEEEGEAWLAGGGGRGMISWGEEEGEAWLAGGRRRKRNG